MAYESTAIFAALRRRARQHLAAIEQLAHEFRDGLSDDEHRMDLALWLAKGARLLNSDTTVPSAEEIEASFLERRGKVVVLPTKIKKLAGRYEQSSGGPTLHPVPDEPAAVDAQGFPIPCPGEEMDREVASLDRRTLPPTYPYPPGWPRCVCGDFVMDGKATCGRVECLGPGPGGAP